MTSLRNLTFRFRGAALLLVAVALAFKAFVPAGFMVRADARIFTVEVCSDTTGLRTTRQIAIPFEHHQGSPDTGKTSTVCPFASLWAGGLAGDFPEIAAVEIAFVLALGFAATAFPSVRWSRFLRPPLRAPPEQA